MHFQLGTVAIIKTKQLLSVNNYSFPQGNAGIIDDL